MSVRTEQSPCTRAGQTLWPSDKAPIKGIALKAGAAKCCAGNAGRQPSLHLDIGRQAQVCYKRRRCTSRIGRCNHFGYRQSLMGGF